jgi:tRNA dimethylallyltransferase
MFDRETRRKRISERLKQRLDSGMVEEVKNLIDRGINADTLIYYGLEYKFITLFLTGKINYQEMVHDLETAIHQFAKRQMTWFRGMERRGIKIHWIEGELPMKEKVKSVLDKLIEH